MFTVKLYDTDPSRVGKSGAYKQVIKEADQVTVIRLDDGTAEVTLHTPQGDVRYDIKADPDQVEPRCFESAIIENSAGRTTEMVRL